MVLWQASLLTMIACVMGTAGIRKNDKGYTHTWTTFESVMYNCFHRTGWSLALGWIIFSCHKGYGGLINDFLSWKAFLPLSKLTYGAYLVHIQVQFIVIFSQTSPMYLSDFLLSQYFIGFLAFTFGISFVFSLSLELPFANLEKLILSSGSKPKMYRQKSELPEELQRNGKIPNGEIHLPAQVDVPKETNEEKKAKEAAESELKKSDEIMGEDKLANVQKEHEPDFAQLNEKLKEVDAEAILEAKPNFDMDKKYLY